MSEKKEETHLEEFSLKRPNNAQSFELERKEDLEDQLDFFSFFGTMFGIMGLMMRYRIFIWQSLICAIIYICNARTLPFEWSKVISSFSVPMMGLVMCYFGPNSDYFY
jgi:uncharacterized membrane protein